MKNIKFKKLDSKNKKMWIGLAVVVVVVVAVIFYVTGRSHSVESSNNVLDNKYVDGLSFENATLKYDDGVSTLNVEVYNESGEIYNLKTIDINVITEDDKQVVLVGYIGDSLEVGEGKILKTSIDQDLSKAKSIVYKINK